MTMHDPITKTSTDSQDPQGAMSHGGHGWMMIASCIPMLVIAVVLVATGAVPGLSSGARNHRCPRPGVTRRVASLAWTGWPSAAPVR
jgi:hypothetical protein